MLFGKRINESFYDALVTGMNKVQLLEIKFENEI